MAASGLFGIGVLVLALCLGCPAQADPLSDGKLAYQKHDFVLAAKLFRVAAEDGNPDAQSLLGFMYHDGEGVPKDLVRSYMWFNLALSLYPADSEDFDDAGKALDMIEKQLTREQIATARAMASACQSRRYKGCD